jgi:hypothetical protein
MRGSPATHSVFLIAGYTKSRWTEFLTAVQTHFAIYVGGF